MSLWLFIRENESDRSRNEGRSIKEMTGVGVSKGVRVDTCLSMRKRKGILVGVSLVIMKILIPIRISRSKATFKTDTQR